MKYLPLFIMTTVLLFSCKSKKNLGTSVEEKPFSDEQVAAINTRYPGVTANQLVNGQSLYKGNCKKCHALKKPENYTEAQWNKIMPDMAKKAKIDEGTEKAIMTYVLSFSKTE